MTEQADNNSFNRQVTNRIQSSAEDSVQKYMADMIKIYKNSNNYIKPKLTEHGKSFSEDTDSGFLQVEVTSGKGAIPIENAKITVLKDSEGKVPLKSMTTNNAGETAVIPLPTQSMGFQVTRNGKTYSTYNIVISADGYYPAEKLHVPVFSTIKSIQAVDLIPMVEF